MDTLSRLLHLSQGELILDVFCRLSGDFLLPHPPSSEKETIFHLVLSGECQVQIENSEPLALSEGAFLMLNRGQSHTIWRGEDIGSTVQLLDNDVLPVKCSVAATDGQSADILCGRMVYAEGSGQLLLNGFPDFVLADLSALPGIEVLEIFTRLIKEEALDRKSGASAMLNGLVQVLFIFALRCYERSGELNYHWLTLQEDPRLSKALNAMISEPHRDWTVISLANLSLMSRATFARRFKACAGVPPGDVLQSIRMMKALSLLKEKKNTLSYIATSVGYQSEAAFSQAFKRILGCRPREWRKYQGRHNDI